MPEPATVAFAAAAVANVAGGILGSKSADKAAQKAAKAQMRLTGIQRAEERRQLGLDFLRQRGEARLAAYASNLIVDESASTRAYLTNIESEQRRQLRYIDRANQAEQLAIKQGARGAGDALLIQGLTNAVSSAASAYAAETTA